MLSHRGIVSCGTLQLHLLRKSLSKGNGLLDLHSSSRVVIHPHLSSRMAQGQMPNKEAVPTITTAVSSVGVRIILPSNAPRRDKLKGKDFVRIIRIRIRSKWCKSGKGGLTSPLLLNFQKERQSYRVHFLCITNPQLSYSILVHLIASSALNLEQNLV